MVEKVTIMVLKVDLQCQSCYRKVKKVLCKFPQIRDQVYDQKQNTVTIIVVCCSPEKIRDKLCCKGGKAIKSIEIKDPPKPTSLEKPKSNGKPTVEPPKEAPPPKAPELAPPLPKAIELAPPPSKAPEPASPPPKAPEQAPPTPFPLVPACCGECYEGRTGGPCYQGFGPGKRACCGECYEGRTGGPCYQGFGPGRRACCGECYEGRTGGPCYQGFGLSRGACCGECFEGRTGGPCYQGFSPSMGACCGECHEGRTDGPCYQGYQRPVPWYDNYGATWYGYGGRSRRYVTRCDEYLGEENATGCSIM